MTAPPYFPAYRLTVKAPRSVDATEATTLTPIGGAPHSDPFVVTSIQGVSGAKPYLDLPRGKQGAIDVLSKKATIGALTLRILDTRVSSGNAQRWFTAFIGDANGKLRLKGCKAILEESLDNGSSWTTIFTGRLGDIGLDSKLYVSLEIRSIADDMGKLVFTGKPYSSITYAFQPSLFPAGLPQAWGTDSDSLGVVHAKPRIQATIAADDFFYVGGRILKVTAGQDPWLTGITKQAFAASIGIGPTARAIVKILSGALSGNTYAFNLNLAYLGNESFNVRGALQNYRVTRFGGLTNVDSSDPLYHDINDTGNLPNGTTCEFYVIDDVPVSEDRPLLIDDVHPVQLWADILDGNFSTLLNFSPRIICARDSTAFTNLIADTSLGKGRWIITDSAPCNEWIEKNICQPFNLAYRLDGQGRVVPIDLRLTAAASVTGSIVDSDLTDLSAQWKVDGSRAVFATDITYYVDREIPTTDLNASSETYPDVPLSLIESFGNRLIVVNPDSTARDSGDQMVGVDATGIRLTQGEFGGGGATLTALDKIKRLQARMLDVLPPFAGGAVFLPLRVRRSSTAGSSALPGTFWTVTVTTIPDPGTNQRGGTRLMLCTSRTENGIAVDLELLDVGSNATANTPTVGTLASANGGVNVPITLNASSDPVRVEYAITAAGTGSRPGETGIWQYLDTYLTSTTKSTGFVPTGTRLWVRARSQPLAKNLKQPSAWVYPAAGTPAGSIDITAITAPSAVGHSSLVGNRTIITWTVGDATKNTEVYVYQGASAPGTWTQAMKQEPVLHPGSNRTIVRDLSISTQYTVGVCHVDGIGGRSAFATHTFTTTGTPSTAPTPPKLGVPGKTSGGTGSGGVSTTTPKGRLTTGVALTLFPADPAYQFEIQEAPDLAGAPDTGSAATIENNISGRQDVYLRKLPLDNAQRWYRTRHVGYGDTASSWTDWVASTPVIQPPNGPTGSLASPINAQDRFRCKLRRSAGVTIPSGVETTIFWDVEDANVGGIHSLSANTERITIPTGGDIGFWEFHCAFDLLNNATAGQRTVRIRWSNGSIIVAEKILTVTNEWEDDLRITMPSVSVGDYFWVTVTQVSGVNQTFAGGGQIGNFSAIHKW